MQLFVTILHVMLSFTLIGIILLQPGKDGASVLGGGGGGNQMYGPRGQANLLGRATTVIAGLFMVTSITLAWYSGERTTSSDDLEQKVQEAIEAEAEDTILLSPAPEPEEAAAPAGILSPTPDAPEPTNEAANGDTVGEANGDGDEAPAPAADADAKPAAPAIDLDGAE